MTDGALDLRTLAAIARRHGLPALGRVPVPRTGATSRVYPCGEVVVKVPFANPAAIAAVRADAAMAPIARGLGVATPEVLAVDEACDLLPVPYVVSRRIASASPLEQWRGHGAALDAWRATGRQLALVHTVRDGTGFPLMLRVFRQTPEVDPRPWVEEMAGRGVIGPGDARWLGLLLDELAPAAHGDEQLTLCHGDINAANVLVDATHGGFRALIDWAGAGWLDPVWDLAGVPLDAVPHLLAGHREVAPLPGDATAGARALWCQLQTRLFIARTGAGDAPLDLGEVRRAVPALLGA
jgi:aminoglycoside phosphotransferase (APT) family kinase protein